MASIAETAAGGVGQSGYGGPMLGALLTVLSTVTTIVDIFQTCNDPVVLLALTIFVLAITTAVAIFFAQLGVIAPTVAALSPVSLMGLATIFSVGVNTAIGKLRTAGGC